MPKFDTCELGSSFIGAQRNPGGMSASQYFRVTVEIMSRAPANVLIFGAGADTPLYVSANPLGRTVVLEHHKEWRERIGGVQCEVISVKYSTRVRDKLKDSPILPGSMPKSLLGVNWDVILVDSPEGHTPDMPGREQSIFAAATVQNRATKLFLHDFNRRLELEASKRWLGAPLEIIGNRPALAIF